MMSRAGDVYTELVVWLIERGALPDNYLAEGIMLQSFSLSCLKYITMYVGSYIFQLHALNTYVIGFDKTLLT